jgi:hypothetical protein
VLQSLLLRWEVQHPCCTTLSIYHAAYDTTFPLYIILLTTRITFGFHVALDLDSALDLGSLASLALACSSSNDF